MEEGNTSAKRLRSPNKSVFRARVDMYLKIVVEWISAKPATGLPQKRSTTIMVKAY